MFFKMAPNLMWSEFTRMPTYAWIRQETSSSRKYWKLFLTVKWFWSVRQEDSWVKSAMRQLDSLYAFRSKIVSVVSPTAKKIDYVLDSFLNVAIGSFNTKSTYVMRKRFRIHNHRVKSIVPAEKLLVNNVKEGWKPLCDFLECEVPTIAFPHENIKAEITAKLLVSRCVQQMRWEVRRAFFAIGSVLIVIVGIFLAFCLYQWHFSKSK